jgi:hypothetical protein
LVRTFILGSFFQFARETQTPQAAFRLLNAAADFGRE